jgi:hypothetical protein
MFLLTLPGCKEAFPKALGCRYGHAVGRISRFDLAGFIFPRFDFSTPSRVSSPAEKAKGRVVGTSVREVLAPLLRNRRRAHPFFAAILRVLKDFVQAVP